MRPDLRPGVRTPILLSGRVAGDASPAVAIQRNEVARYPPSSAPPGSWQCGPGLADWLAMGTGHEDAVECPGATDRVDRLAFGAVFARLAASFPSGWLQVAVFL